MKTISQSGLDLIKQFEGLRLTAYLDVAGVPTIGYGSTYCICGDKITLQSKPITEEVAEFMLKINSKIYQNAVNTFVTWNINQNQFDALVSFAYNLGVKNLQNSTLVKKINTGDIESASREFGKWVNAGGKVVKGLVNRREKERVLFLS